ncbi:MAG: SAM-dependent methyltransferase [Bacteroidia bacterium]|nr:MAG: SAM-dependent methyltransferase [Bacteroidia bacterium]
MEAVRDPAYWRKRYQEGQTGWDLGGPTPVLVDLLEKGAFPVRPPARVLVPGCGYGHDVVLLASAGYQVVGLDLAPEPLEVLARRLPPSGQVWVGNFLTVSAQELGFFDALWEYTCWCAIAPADRKVYMQQAARLLVKGGWLVGLFFPLSMGEGYTGGPPFLVDLAEVQALAEEAHFRVVRREKPLSSHPARLGREALLFLQKS